MSVQVSKLVIKIGDKEIELSLAEARELLQILDDTLQPDEPRKVVEHHWYPYQALPPVTISPAPRWDRWTITYNNAGGTIGMAQPSVMYINANASKVQA